MKVSAKQLFNNCYGKYGIAAVNIDFMEQVLALFAAAEKANAPFIVQTTPLAREYASPEMLMAMIKTAAKLHPKAIFAIHLDHGVEDHVLHAINGDDYTSVMIDASHDDFEKNVQRTKAIVDKAKAKNITVEAELGVLAGVEDGLTIDEAHSFYTDPNEVEEFVNTAGCDSLAIAVGTSHGAYKFSGGQGIQFHILEDIQNRLPEFPLVLHGGSAVNYTEIEKINNSGGQLKTSAKGVDPLELKKSIEYGVCKINIATDFRLLWTRVYREYFEDEPEAFHPVPPGKIYIEEFKKMALERFDFLGATGQAANFKI